MLNVRCQFLLLFVMTTTPDISCIIATRNRAESLRITLECLAKADRTGLDCEVVVVDNGSEDDTLEVAARFRDRLPLRILEEPTLGTYGKVQCLNRALDEGTLGAIVVVLDDDMSPHEDWFQGVAAISRRWPDCDLFTGRSYIIWPEEGVPEWARSPRIRAWAYSVMDGGMGDHLLRPGRWFSGNHFWFRARALEQVDHFADEWITEADFQMDLAAAGCRGVAGPDAVAGHRVQEHLLDRAVLISRAKLVGRSFAAARIRPQREGVRVAELFRQHPFLMRCYCRIFATGWGIKRRCFGALGGEKRFVDRYLEALERESYLRALLKEVADCPEYC